MKRFAVLYWQWPPILGHPWRFIREEFDKLHYKTANELQSLSLDGYEFIWWYLMWGGGLEGWKLPKMVRRSAKNVKILLQMDNWGLNRTIGKRGQEWFLPYVDALGRITDREDWTFPNYYVNFPQPLEKLRRKHMLPLDQREDFVALLHHFGALSLNALKTVKEAGYRVTLFSDIHKDRKRLNSWLKTHSLDGSKCFPRLPESEYLAELAKCKVAIEDPDNYPGFSRFVCNCASLAIPVVGSWKIKAVSVIFPELCTDPHAPEQTKLIQMLMEDDDVRAATAEKGYLRLKHHLSEEECTKRLKNAMRAMGVKI